MDKGLATRLWQAAMWLEQLCITSVSTFVIAKQWHLLRADICCAHGGERVRSWLLLGALDVPNMVLKHKRCAFPHGELQAGGWYVLGLNMIIQRPQSTYTSITCFTPVIS